MTRRYPAYRDSGVEWLGEVPAGWELSRLRFVADFTSGGTPNREKLEFWGGHIPWVSPKDMKSARIDSTEESITELGLAESATSLFDVGTVLIVARSGILKHTIPVAVNVVPVSVNQDIKAVRFDESRILPAYFVYLVVGHNDELLLLWSKQGATVESLEQQYISDSYIPLPSLSEQTAIASFLDRETAKIDALVAEQRRLIDLLKEKRQAVISHAVTRGLNPAAKLKPSGVDWLGDVPEGWEVKKLAHSLSEFPCYGVLVPDSDPDGVPMVRINDLTADALDREHFNRISPELSNEYRRTLVQRGDVVLAVVGTLGYARVVGSELEGCNLSRAVARIQVREELAADFLVWVLNSGPFVHFTDLVCVGTAQRVLNMGDLSGFVFALPPLREQLAIAAELADKVSKLDGTIKTAEHSIDLLRERRAALISAAVTGKIDVRDLVPQETEAA